jgi:hypothetical protein
MYIYRFSLDVSLVLVPDCGDRRSGGKGHRTTETGQAKDETQRARELDW